VLKNRTPIEIEQAVVALAIDQPAWGQVRISEALKRRGLSISPAGVRCVWLRHDLTSIKHRLKALEAKVAQEGILLTEAQIIALEKAKADKEAHGEFESECPGYCGAQDTFYVGTLKGVGRIYQQTVIDTYAKVAFAKLYDRKTPITAAEIRNDRVVPFYDEHGIRLSRMLTDRGTEFCGSQSHEYELYLAVEDVDHSRTKTKSPQTNGSCERFHAPSWTSSTGLRSARRSIWQSTSCRPILTSGLSSTTNSAPIRAAGASVRPRCRPSLTHCHCQWRGRNSWLLDDGQDYIGSNSQHRLSGQVSTNTVGRRQEIAATWPPREGPGAASAAAPVW
jgi:transposase InsO family protein